jgi:hypothetical protein
MELDQIKLDRILGEYFCQHYMIDINDYYKIEEIDAKELLVPERIDLIAKLKYIEYREKGYSLDYIKELYKAHIEAFSNGSYTEPGNDSKNSINKYFDTFNNLIDNIKQSGLDEKISVIPVGKNNVILDGAHRVAIAAYFNLKLPIIRFENLYANYGVEFFKKRLLSEKYIDYLVTEYCKLKDNLYFACIWPEFKGNLQLNNENVLTDDEFKVFYSKKIKISYEGLHNLITQIYSNRESIGDLSDNFERAINEFDDSENYLTIHIFECNSFSKILELKANILTTFKEENYPIHITDNQNEAIQLANILLNKNSVDFLHQGKPNHYFELQSWSKRKVRNLKHNSRRNLVLLTRKIGLYRELRIFYNYLRDIVK